MAGMRVEQLDHLGIVAGVCLATSYEKRAVNYRAMVVIAAIGIWLDT